MSLMIPHDRPLLYVNLDVLARNWHTVCSTFRGQRVGAVVKNDAYGLGLAQVATALWSAGCRNFWVSHMSEALNLRALLLDHDTKIMVLHGLAGQEPQDFPAQGLTPVLTGPHELRQVRGYAAKYGTRLQAAIHLDTGLTRLGFSATDLPLLQNDSTLQTDIQITMWVSHLGRFSDPEAPECLQQRQTFRAWTQQLPRAARSITTSSSVFADPDWHCDHARVGSALFGVQTAAKYRQPLGCVGTLYAPVLRVAEVPTGTEIGYGGQYRTTHPMRIATVAAGYGDGVPFSLANRGAALYLKGRPAPIVGGIAMGMLALDVSAFAPNEITSGMWAEVYGQHQPLEQLAAAAGVAANTLLVGTGTTAMRQYTSPPVTQEPLT